MLLYILMKYAEPSVLIEPYVHTNTGLRLITYVGDQWQPYL
jgi:hypothetical protein